MLHRATRAGLPVPGGFVIRDGEAPADLGAHQRWAVRSSFSAEDLEGKSGAGAFRTELNVAGPDVPQAVLRVRGSGGASMRRDVLVMKMVAAQVAGVAFLQSEYLDDLVNWIDGLGDRLVSGLEAGQSMELARQGVGHSDRLEPWQRRLRSLLSRVRSVFGDLDWDVEWADDGSRCWLLQVRPITSPPRRNDAFTLANHKEILPDLPSRLMATAIEECAGELFEYYRQFDSSLPRKRLFIEMFEGRPLINISLMSDLMRHWGLPTALVTGNIGGTTARPAPLHLPRLLRKLPSLIRMGLAQFQSAAEARRIIRHTGSLLQEEPASFAAAIEQLEAAYIALVRGMFGLTAAMSGPLSLLRATGQLEIWSARWQTPGAAMFEELEQLRGLSGEPFEEGWNAWLERHGHRGVYESDVARPRFREEPRKVLPAPHGEAPRRRTPHRLNWKALALWPVWLQARRPLLAREQFRSEMMRSFELVRLRLLRLAAAAQIEPRNLWMLSAKEVRQLDEGWRPNPDFLRDREREIQRLEEVCLPDLVRRFDDLSQAQEPAAGADRIRGISLTSGDVTGRAWTPREPGESLPEGFKAADTILVVRSVDAGWVPTFLHVAGVAVETGGDLSHGSIILREIGLPAITNAGQELRGIRQGDHIRLRASIGVLEKIAAYSPIESKDQPAVF
jgi:pyruvate,water dikinase